MLFNKGELSYINKENRDGKRFLWVCSVLQFVPIVSRLKEAGAKLTGISASVVKEKGVVLDYYFDVGGRTGIVQTIAENNSIGSLYTLFANADFVEREINNVFNITFLGHPNLPRYGNLD